MIILSQVLTQPTQSSQIDTGSDITSIIGIGGPIGGIAVILVYLLRAYLLKRQDDREDKKLGIESETGIVETTGKALEIVRAQMDRMEQDQIKIRTENDVFRTRIDEQALTIRNQELHIGRLESRVNWLEVDNKELKEEIAFLRGDHNG